MERKLNFSRDEIYRLKQERDRLVSISSELRAELNKAKSRANQFKSMLDKYGFDDNGQDTYKGRFLDKENNAI